MGTNDREKAASCLAPDACAIAKGYGKFSGRRDHDVMVGMIDEFKKLVPTGLRFTIHNVIADGDRIAIEAEGNAVTSQGKPYRNQCFRVHARERQDQTGNEYFCNVHANEVLWPLVEASGVGAATS